MGWRKSSPCPVNEAQHRSGVAMNSDAVSYFGSFPVDLGR